ncbi:hypothetical protein ACFVWR_08835 [Leifsonia sp. NPDC058292]|uniref:hypothetical protein n=1 Tax=Leifsonia sp. NPDC058292 TaxID=3346428 RepID=UPI0036DC1FC7
MSSSVRESALRLRGAVTQAVSAARDSGRHPIVLIDGPSGAGKSSLADLLVSDWPEDVPPQLVRMDDVYPGWGGLDAASSAIERDLLAPFRAGAAAGWLRWDWTVGAPAEWNAVSRNRPLIVEGCGTLSRENSQLADLALWLDADDRLRKRRALARDGLSFATHWDQWQHDFERYVLREHPRANASLVLDVTTWPLGVRAGVSDSANVGGMTDSQLNAPEYIVEYVDGPLSGTTDRRVLIDGKVDERIGAVAAIDGLESLFWYAAGEEREVNGEKYVKYHFDAPDSDPVESDEEQESL